MNPMIYSPVSALFNSNMNSSTKTPTSTMKLFTYTIPNKFFKPLFPRLNSTILPAMRNVLKMSWNVMKPMTYSPVSALFNSTMNPSTKTPTSTMKLFTYTKNLLQKCTRSAPMQILKCQKFHNGTTPWSPQIQTQQDRIDYWHSILQIKTGVLTSKNAIKRLSIKLGEYSCQYLSAAAALEKLKGAQKEY